MSNTSRHATHVGECKECFRVVLLRHDGYLRRHKTFKGIYCEEIPSRSPREPKEGTVRPLTRNELRELREGTVKYVVRFHQI